MIFEERALVFVCHQVNSFFGCSPILQLLLQLLFSTSDLLASRFRDSKDTVSGVSLILVGGCQRLIV